MRFLIVSLDVLPPDSPSWWRLFDTLFRAAYPDADVTVDLLDLLPADSAFYVADAGRPLCGGPPLATDDTSSSANNADPIPLWESPATLALVKNLFPNGVKPASQILRDDIEDANVRKVLPGSYFPAETADEATHILDMQASRHGMYDWILFPGSRLCSFHEESREMRKFATIVVDRVYADDSFTSRLMGVCYGFQLLAEVLVGEGTVAKSPNGFAMEQGLRRAGVVTGCQEETGTEVLPSPDRLLYSHGDFVGLDKLSPGALKDAARRGNKHAESVVPTHWNPHLKEDVEADPREWLSGREVSGTESACESTNCSSEGEGGVRLCTPLLRLAEIFTNTDRSIVAFQGHPEFTTRSFSQVWQRFCERPDAGVNGWAGIPPFAEPKAAADGRAVYRFPRIMELADVSAGKNISSEQVACWDRGQIDIKGCWSRVPGVDEWIGRVMRSMVRPL